ncbi:MAG: NAD-dependent epimerase/dehydratase family protein [Thermoleophilia bacterium]|nr:NAD-dependent epimerase/dehydratase family protein [Thermoleophilia bacterium]
MRVVVVGATGNVGTSLVAALADEPAVDSVLGLARRRPALAVPKTEWAEADISRDDLRPLFRGAGAVVHLAWLLQPTRDRERLWRVNVDGSTRLFTAVREARVPALVYASSIGAYSRAPKDGAVDERWPTEGIPQNAYSREKAELERRLDRFEREAPGVRVVRLRPALTFKYESASEQRRLFAGPFLPRSLLRRELVPALPDIPGLRVQAVHTADVADAYRRALVSDASGPFNVAAEPVLSPAELAAALGARLVRVPARAVRGASALAWRLRLIPVPASWLDLALAVPVMDTARARELLGWRPERTALAALEEVVRGVRDGAGLDTPPLSPATSGRFRSRELAAGVGGRDL